MPTSQDERLIGEIIRRVADRTIRPPEELPPLNAVVDPDALRALFATRPDGTRRLAGRVTFPYAGHRVTVTADGHVEVEPL